VHKDRWKKIKYQNSMVKINGKNQWQYQWQYQWQKAISKSNIKNQW
jgi:hypothetical protein